MLFLMVTFLFSSWTYATTTEILCGNTNPSSSLISKLAKNGKYEWCMSGVCEENSKTFERTKCVKHLGEDQPHENSFSVSHSETHREPNSLSLKSYAGFYRLYPEDSCYEECRPEEKKNFLGISKQKLGLDKEQCARCMIKLPPHNPESYEVVGHGVTVHKGQQCFSLCRLPGGPYLDHRPYSTECLNCIGVQGVKPIFEYLVNKSGECFELRDGRYQGASKVPESFCKSGPFVYSTHYKKSSKFAMSTLIFGEPQKCYEVDDKSDGKYYTRQVQSNFCDNETIDDSQRGTNKDSTPSLNSSRPASRARSN